MFYIYNKINKIDIIKILIQIEYICWDSCGIISPSNIRDILNTSRYQVNKIIKDLKRDDIISYKSIMIYSEDEFYPPYQGYCLSEKGKQIFKKEIEEAVDYNSKLILKLFG